MMQPTDSLQEQSTYCAVHPDRETGLRCNRCDRYMCAQCAVHTPVGYRCRECVRQVDNRFFAGTPRDYAVSGAISLALGVAAGGIALWTNVLLLSLILGLPVGAGVAELGLRATQRRRGRQSAEVAAGAFLVGALLGACLFLILEYQDVYAPLAEFADEFNRSMEELGPDGGAVRGLLEAQGGLYIPLNAGEHIVRTLTDVNITLPFYLFTLMAVFAVYRRIKT